MKFWQAVTRLPIDEVLPVAKKAEEVGFATITTSDHVFYPKDISPGYPYTEDGMPVFPSDSAWPDVWCLISAMAAVTERVTFSNCVYVAPMRSLFVVARSVGTAASISGNRVAVGLAAGWMREEFEAMGQDFRTRGRRLNEMIEALRELWSGGYVEYHGEHVDFPPLRMDPAPTAPIPIYCGGVSDAAIHRAVTLCDGWINEGARPLDEVEALVTRVKREREEAGKPVEGFEIISGTRAAPTLATYQALEAMGVDAAIVRPPGMALGAPAMPLQEKLEIVERFGEEIIDKI